MFRLSGNIDSNYAFTYKVPIDYGYKSPKNKRDLFNKAIYAYNEMYMTFENTAELSNGVKSGTFDLIGDEGSNTLKKTPEVAYVISNATVNDMTR